MLQFKKDLLGSSSVDYYGKPKRYKSRKSKKYGSQHKKYRSQKTKGFGGIGGTEWNRRKTLPEAQRSQGIESIT